MHFELDSLENKTISIRKAGRVLLTVTFKNVQVGSVKFDIFVWLKIFIFFF